MDVWVIAPFVIMLVIALMVFIVLLRQGRPSPMSQDLSVRLAALERISSELSASFRDEAHISRDDARQVLANQTHMMDRRLNELSTFQSGQLSSMRKEASDHRARLEESIQRHVDNFSHTQTTQLKATNDALRELSDRLTLSQEKGVQTQKEGLQAVTERIGALMETHSTAQEKLRDTVSGSLERLQKDNADKLERMRATVEEKLQGTLEKRLGESFQLVSDRLEQVHKGLGEMQTLATGVGDLKRVLTNVKSRGGWGEVQLGMLLDDMLTREQYESNVKVLPGSDKLVDYAVKLPGNSQPDEPLWLPIDAKFPHEDYERLLQAQDTGNPEEIERYSSALEKAVRLQAKSISEKYIHPPHTTDFAIMYLPTEGLFAEVIRRPGLARDLQATYRIMIQGPTTLSALLTSLQMGFRTLAIEKRSSEVWQVLGAAKSEFMKYGQVWERLGKQLDTAKRTVEEAGKRTRAVERKLRDVELLEEPDESSNILDFMAKGDEENPFSS